MKAKYTKTVGEVQVVVELEFDKFNDDVADMISFVDFPIRQETSVTNIVNIINENKDKS